MLPDRVSNPGPLTYESGALPIALRGPALGSRCTNVAGSLGCFVSDLSDYSLHLHKYTAKTFVRLF